MNSARSLLSLILASSLAIFSLPVSAAATADNGDFSLTQVDALIKEGSYTKARSRIEQLLTTDPGNLDYHLRAARLYKKMGLWSRAIMEYESVRRRSPELAEPYIALSEMYRENLSSDIALSMARKAIRLKPNSKKAVAQLISSLLANYEYQEANEELKGLLKQFPKDGEVRHLAFKLYKETGDLESAKRYLEEAISLAPTKISWLLELSDICEAVGDISCARASVRSYLEVEPDSVEALQKKAWLEERYLFDYQGASNTYSRILELDPESWVAEAGLERLKLKRKDAAEAMKRAVRKFFSDIATWFSELGSS